MNEFWTSEKLGKHPQVAEEAARLFKQYALCPADKLLARLKESRFKFGNVGPISWNSLLTKANLDDCLKQDYVKAALKVTTAQPAIGKGEFLFVSLFDNVGFAKDHGDLIDLQTKKKVEVKGISSALCNGYSSNYRQLTQGPDEYRPLNQEAILNTVFKKFKLSPPAKLDAGSCKELERFASHDDDALYYILDAFRNTAVSRRPVIESAMANYKNRSKHNLLSTIAAMHLYDYLKTEHTDYFLAVNNNQFMCFTAPTNVYQAASILEYFTIDGWQIGKRGMTVTLK